MPRGIRATGYGAAGGRRNTASRSAKQRTRRDRRLADPRVRDAMNETRELQEALDAQMEAEAQNPAIGHTQGALLKQQLEAAQSREADVKKETELIEEVAAAPAPIPAPKVVKKKAAAKKEPESDFIMIPRFKPFDIKSVPSKAEGHWALGNARQMVIKGYSIAHVVQTTGWGAKWFDDIPVDEDGYGLGQEEWLESIGEEPAGELSK